MTIVATVTKAKGGIGIVMSPRQQKASCRGPRKNVCVLGSHIGVQDCMGGLDDEDFDQDSFLS